MKILLSAFSCEPDKGSEPSVGWNWSIELAKTDHDIWVITWTNNKEYIENYFSHNSQPPNLHFLYYDLPDYLIKYLKNRFGIRLYYVLWQWNAYNFIKKIHKNEKFDCVHHVTFVSLRFPSFMGKLGIPFIFGPVAGGENAPWRLRNCYGILGFVIDAIRDLSNLWIKIDPFMRATFKQAHKIIATSNQTKELIPKKFQGKTQIQLAIGLNTNDFKIDSSNTPKKSSQFKILYMGRFVYWKGMDIGIRAFAYFLKTIPTARLTMVGQGQDEKKWKKLTEMLDISSNVDWVPWVNRNQISNLFAQHDLFLFPSLHDSGGMVVLESIAHGLPVICTDIGGPGIIIDDSCGKKISVQNKTTENIAKEIAEKLIELYKDKNLRQDLSSGGIARIKQFNWKNIVNTIYSSSETQIE